MVLLLHTAFIIKPLVSISQLMLKLKLLVRMLKQLKSQLLNMVRLCVMCPPFEFPVGLPRVRGASF
ncbi:hypothetical protein C4J91_0170 [Pseudomonas sp. R3-52-08]|nr:hypothetical protein C4J91_0170 [Pseudomonas sp. R3-52-08]